MTIIHFEIDINVLNRTDRKPIQELESYFFTSTLFIMPVRFRIDETELFDIEGDPWAPAPIMCLATEVIDVIKNLKNTKKATYIVIEGPGDFEFTMIDDENVKIDFDGYNHTIVTVKYDELLKALLKYAEKVRNFLLEYVAEMKKHPYWGPWLLEKSNDE